MTICDETCKNFELKSLTTLKIGGNAEFAFLPKTEDEFVNTFRFIKNENLQYNIIGAGSNLLISSKGVKGACLITRNLKDISQSGNRMQAFCGAKSSAFAKVAFDAGLKDAEFLIGIPGSIGGAIYMNAGAHGQNIRDIIESVQIFDVNKFEIVNLPLENLYFNYRSSIFSDNDYKIISASFKLPSGNIDEIKAKMEFHVNYRAEHHPPLTEYSAGSTFRNPEGDYAANLLEKVGAKEYVENEKVKFSSKHANFLYNFNDASSTDVVRLMYKMWKRVYDEFGIKLHPEIKFIGEKSDEEIELWENMTKL